MEEENPGIRPDGQDRDDALRVLVISNGGTVVGELQ
jgi:hypothetical protein